MGYRFTKEDIRTQQIVDSRQFDQAVGTFVDVLNGGLDRDNIPQGSIGTSQMNDNVFCKMFFLNDQFAADEYQNIDANTDGISPNRPNCQLGDMTYGKEPLMSGGGWVEGPKMSIVSEEGMLEISWHCSEVKGQYWAYYKNHTTARVALKSSQWEIRIDGNAVYTGPDQYEVRNTFIHRCNVPISRGAHTISVHYRVQRQKEDGEDSVILNWWGGQLVGINRYR